MSQYAELYRFGQGVFYVGFTSGPTPISYNGVTYQPLAITRSKVEVTDDVYQSSLQVTFPRSEQFALDLLNFSNEVPWNLVVFRGVVGSDDYLVNWSGRVVSSKANGDEVDLECESIYTTIKRPGLKARYSKTCRHELYDSGCKESPVFRSATVVTVNGTALTLDVPSQSGIGLFQAGILKLSETEFRFITANGTDDFTINRPARGLGVGDTVYVAYGCDHSKGVCESRFNNLDNFGGFPWIPSTNPFNSRVQ
ncbi:hypothetical protein NVP2117O_44 [Vibrio phage 2.117.O._10N.261.45.E9]|nr:hypothetical protein NVP1117O_44 [Vibrio phage 1.117.O._10N.261.45.E9]AUR95445.1 hypothetical protein NVP1207B_38 [Vibrio phage 1.207.B._10N.222.51.C2]AUS02336.1 hypothetical protein NVP2117O_44 [Vibrio phage 2.117.O._10N.261.45.E9]